MELVSLSMVHSYNKVPIYLNKVLPRGWRGWVGRASEDEQHRMLWPPKSTVIPSNITDASEYMFAVVNIIENPTLLRV